jgi:hypothetical protein
MAFDWESLGDWNPETIGQSKEAKPGKAHLMVTAIDRTDKNWKVRLEIVAHDDPKQAGREVWDFLPVGGAGLEKTISFGLSSGAFTRQNLADCKANGTDPEVLLPRALGKTVCCKLVENEYKGKTNTKPAFIFLRPGSPDTEGWPLNLDILGTPAPTPEVKAPATAVAASDDTSIPF